MSMCVLSDQLIAERRLRAIVEECLPVFPQTIFVWSLICTGRLFSALLCFILSRAECFWHLALCVK